MYRNIATIEMKLSKVKEMKANPFPGWLCKGGQENSEKWVLKRKKSKRNGTEAESLIEAETAFSWTNNNTAET